MSRVRRRKARSPSEDREWEMRAAELRAHHGARLAISNEYFAREPGVPAELREPVRMTWLLATRQADRERLRAGYEAALEARRRWLVKTGYR